MTDAQSISDYWGRGDVYARILAALGEAGLSPDRVTVEQLAPLDHLHARGLVATRELADVLPIRAEHRIIDIGCGIGGPARYMASRFRCQVEGLDITESFVSTANRLTEMVGMSDRVSARLGDGSHLPYADESFDGAYSQHVTMNVADRAGFFAEAFRVLRPGGFFALTEQGLGPAGGVIHPVPWSEDGSGEYLIRPADTVATLTAAGFVEVDLTELSAEYSAGYRQIAARGDQRVPTLGVHVLLGPMAPEKLRNAARNVDERRTEPIQVLCRKPT